MNTTSYRTVAFFAAALALLALSMGPVTAADAPKPASHAVAIDGTNFQPAMLAVKVGDSVTWTNKDPFPHTVTSTAGGFDSHEIAPGKSWKYTATKKGEFAYVCLLHPTMKATLKVE
ncbi:MAG: cupredoxin family copper-binding protein [Pseudomonadota bacterium]|nr:cupredoxin family copper-binding protein [Pseudomonadota bacterium]